MREKMSMITRVIFFFDPATFSDRQFGDPLPTPLRHVPTVTGQRAAIPVLPRNGVPVGTIAEAFYCKEKTVWRWSKQETPEDRPRLGQPSMLTPDEIKGLLKAQNCTRHVSLTKGAAQFGASARTIERVLER